MISEQSFDTEKDLSWLLKIYFAITGINNVLIYIKTENSYFKLH